MLEMPATPVNRSLTALLKIGGTVPSRKSVPVRPSANGGMVAVGRDAVACAHPASVVAAVSRNPRRLSRRKGCRAFDIMSAGLCLFVLSFCFAVDIFLPL